MILCCGEALIDMIPVLDGSDGTAFSARPGGSVFNTAIGLGRLGITSGFLSGISTDLFGQQLMRALTESGVDSSPVILSDRPSTLAFVELDNGQARYTFYDENTAGRMLNPNDLPPVPETITALYFGGISLISEPCADFYAALIAREHVKKTIVVDCNIRENFIGVSTTYLPRLMKIIAHADVVKVSDDDLNWIYPDNDSLTDKALRLRAAGPTIVILTLGQDGATAFFGDDQTVSIPAPKVQVVDTIGAGDTFNSGLLANLAQQSVLAKSALRQITGCQIANALEYAVKVAAITVSRKGANPPWAHEIPQLAKLPLTIS
ncbi:MAG: carbohydrate kinase [Rhodobacteraceae bacterium]|nr:carbohydrate kinase [Paracoccaceae bacterium]